MTKIMQAAITGNIWSELERLGIECRTTQDLVWFTDRPFHKRSKLTKHGDYLTILTYNTAVKVYQELRQQQVSAERYSSEHHGTCGT